jgi:hypothetical protein
MPRRRSGADGTDRRRERVDLDPGLDGDNDPTPDDPYARTLILPQLPVEEVLRERADGVRDRGRVGSRSRRAGPGAPARCDLALPVAARRPQGRPDPALLDTYEADATPSPQPYSVCRPVSWTAVGRVERRLRGA